MDQIMDDAYTVTSNLFGPESGIPWWAWLFVVVQLAAASRGRHAPPIAPVPAPASGSA